MDYWGAILFGVFIYAVLCLIIAVIRSLLSQRSTKKQKFKKTLWTWFLEALNPFHWFW